MSSVALHVQQVKNPKGYIASWSWNWREYFHKFHLHIATIGCLINRVIVVFKREWYLFVDWFQVYFPAFVGSSIYLRFLNELVLMLNKDDCEATSVGRSREGASDKSSSGTVLKLSHIIMGKDLDDPDSLWERPAFLYAWHAINYAMACNLHGNWVAILI